MKRSLTLFVSILTLMSVHSVHAQKTLYGPHVIDDGREILIDGCTKLWVVRPGTPWSSTWRLYRSDDTGNDKEARFIADWIIPQDSTMFPDDPLSATLRIEYYGTSLPDLTVNVWAFTTLSQYISDNMVISGMTGTPLFSATGSNGVLEYTDNNGAFWNQVVSAVSAGQLTLAFALPDVANLHDHYFQIDSTSIQLAIQFRDEDSVTITNVVNNIRDWDLQPESRIRGDLNLYTATYADYLQLPHFEPASATRSWDLFRYHLTETWFAKFEHTSLNGYRHKFRHWNETDQSYKVMQHTELFTGLVTDFRAISDTAYQARNLVKREITSPYSGLSFDFKDPWRVEQDLNAGAPDSAQYIHDDFVEQFSPYEPWNDSLSWGVFTDIYKDDDPHYATRFSRYYDYDAGTDSYTRMNGLPLDEGDLIHMDEILAGAGVEIHPTGSIEYTDATVTGTTHRDYRLEYKDGSQTMDFTGVFKAHLLSNKEAQPTRSANQRKIDIDPYGIYHLVYESAGEVWYTQSSDGLVWSQEELVSSYTHNALNASLAVLDSSIYVTFIEDDAVILKRRYKGTWYEYTLEGSSYNNGATTTPVVSAGHMCLDSYGDPKGDIVLVVWDDNEFLQYQLFWLYWLDESASDFGILTTNTTDYPVFPSIDAHSDIFYFTAVWREGLAIKASRLKLPTCNHNFFFLSMFPLPDATLQYDRAVHAPCITHNQESKPVVAYEVSTPSIIYSDRWVNVRTWDATSGSWNTTLYQIPYYQFTQYSDPIAPSIGAHPTTDTCGQNPSPGLRLAFHRNWGGGIRVCKIDCQYAEYDQLMNGESFPSVVPYAPTGLLREAYSAPFQIGPFTHALRTTNQHLTKQVTSGMRMVRDLRVSNGDDVAILGVTELAIRRPGNVWDDIPWKRNPDSLVIGVDGNADQILVTEPFTLSNGNRIEYRSMMFCTDPLAMPSSISLSLQVRKVSDNSLITSFSVPVQSMPSDSSVWSVWSRPIPQPPPFPIFLSLGVEGSIPAGTEISSAKVWLEEQYIPRTAGDVSASAAVPSEVQLEENHPNPFETGTVIPFIVKRDTHVRLSVHDALGREISVLLNSYLPKGRHQATFNPSDLPAGTYIYRVSTESETQTRKMVFIR